MIVARNAGFGSSRRRLSSGESSVTLSVSIAASDNDKAQEVSAGLYAMKLAPQGFVGKFSESIIAIGGSVPNSFAASLPGVVSVGGSKFVTEFFSAAECQTAIGTAASSAGAPLRCCLNTVSRYHHRTNSNPFQEYNFLDTPIRYKMCSQSASKAWVLEK